MPLLNSGKYVLWARIGCSTAAGDSLFCTCPGNKTVSFRSSATQLIEHIKDEGMRPTSGCGHVSFFSRVTVAALGEMSPERPHLPSSLFSTFPSPPPPPSPPPLSSLSLSRLLPLNPSRHHPPSTAPPRTHLPSGSGAGRPVRAGGGAPLEGKGRQRRRWPPWTPAAMVSPCATALSPLLPYSLTHLSPTQTNPAARRPPWRPVPSSARRSSGDPRCAWIRVGRIRRFPDAQAGRHAALGGGALPWRRRLWR